MFKRQQQLSGGTVMEASNDVDEFARSVARMALAQLDTVGSLVPFVLIDRGGQATAHPLTGVALGGAELAALLDVARSGLRSLGREVNRYALAWPGKVVDRGPVDAVFVECAAQGCAEAAVLAVCHWKDPHDGELTTDLELWRLGSAAVRPDWS